MKLRITPALWHNVLTGSIFLAVVVIISYLLPNQNTFKYQFEIGKPWSYDLITASFDFPVYKSDTQVQKEKKAILRDFIPYYKKDTTVAGRQFGRFVAEYKKNTGNDLKDGELIRQRWDHIYQQGIISAEQLQHLQLEQSERIHCITPDKVVHTTDIDEVYTPKTAYETLTSAIPFSVTNYNLHLYMVENLHYDSVINDLSRKEMLKNLSLTSGMVQAGERIVDRGEIVTEELYRILTSL